ALARTSTFALTNATFPYALDLAEKGYKKALNEDPSLRAGLNVCLGAVTHPEVANALGKEFTPPENFC
ncbi:MAG: alanine dehydrogenase, partial [Opitutae bacterium]|nr:alanine dehydrogenase [Opitutae bacterium]